MPYEVRTTSKKTLKAYETAWGHFVAASGGTAPVRIDVTRVAAVAARLEATFKPSVVRYVLGVARMRYGAAWPKGGAYKVKPCDVSRPGLTMEEVERLVAWARSRACGPMLRGYLAMATLYGPRSNELQAIDAADLAADGSTVYLRTSKHGVERNLWVPPSVRQVLLDARFRPRHESELRKAFALLVRYAGVTVAPRTGWHAVRRTLVNALLTDPHNQPKFVQKFMRWRDADIVDVYAEQNGIRTDRTVFEHHPFLPLWERGLEGNERRVQ